MAEEILAFLGLSGFIVLKNDMLRIRINNKRNKHKDELVNMHYNLKNKIKATTTELNQIQNQLDMIQEKIEIEEEGISTFGDVIKNKDTMFTVALGNTGSGKSTVLNRLYGDKSEDGDQGPFESSDSDQSVTQRLSHKQCKICDTTTILVDTPGYKDSKNKDSAHFNNLESYLYGCGGVNAFLLIMNGTNVRFDGNVQCMLKYYAEYFGDKFWNHLIIILTHVEGYIKKKFNKGDRTVKLQQNLRNMFSSVQYDIPIITIGFDDDFSIFGEHVVQSVINISDRNGKLKCDKLKSPIKTLKVLRQELQFKIKTLEKNMLRLKFGENQMKQEILDIDTKITNPERIPLLTNPTCSI
eukprot:382071_1